jgi:co-chaperonin GroES (HSP10)
MKSAFAPHKIKKLRPLNNAVIVEDMIFDERKLSSGIVLLNDNGTSSGIRPRWGKVYAIGSEHQEVKIGQWILVAHGRWTRGIDIEDDAGARTLRRVDPKDILLVSNEQPTDDSMSEAILAAPRAR